MKKWKNYLKHLISAAYCRDCYDKLRPHLEERYFLLPIYDIGSFHAPEDEEFYLHNLTAVESLEQIPISRHYAVRQYYTCPNCGCCWVLFEVFLKVQDTKTTYGSVTFRYKPEYEEQ